MSPSERECHLASANLDLVDGLLGKAGYRRHWLADEFRSAANLALFRAARDAPDADVDFRKYAARSIFNSFANVRMHYRRKRRTWTPLGEALEAGYHPESREVPPDTLAAIREELERAGPPKRTRYATKRRSWLDEGRRAQLEAMLRAEPARDNAAIAIAFFAATRIKIYPSSVRHLRAKLGLPPSTARGGKPPCRASK